MDIMLTKDGDLKISETGDISLTESIRQAVLIRIRWIYGEWRLGPEIGFPWFEEMFVKNPNIVKLKQLIRNEIMEVEGVTDAVVNEVQYDREARSVKFVYTCSVGEAVFKEEVVLNG